MKSLVIFSSANPKGNTAKLIEHLATNIDLEIINLDQCKISPYRYDNQYEADDFYRIFEKILESDNLIFASPTYWYSVTAPMKAFFDRMTELTDKAELKPKARALAYKRAFILTTSGRNQICPIFETFFAEICKYFKMEYRSSLHAKQDEINLQEISQFASSLKSLG
ncbi:NAD(P)H-dependent oxidoreductase [Vibrio caribbeanicus]|uniref:flavodoxin family protein n=1 Tax=Vibrio caribbeanicus TaxID=701175 RepID=UPI0030DBD5A1